MSVPAVAEALLNSSRSLTQTFLKLGSRLAQSELGCFAQSNFFVILRVNYCCCGFGWLKLYSEQTSFKNLTIRPSKVPILETHFVCSVKSGYTVTTITMKVM